MIKLSLSLKTSLILAFISMSLVLVMGYSLLSFSFFFRGMDSIVSVNMENALASYVETFSPSQRLQAREFSGYSFSTEWQQQPLEIQREFYHPPSELGDIRLSKDAPFPLRPSVVYFLIALEAEGQRFYISHKGTASEASPLIGKNARESKQILYGVTISMILLVLIIVWLLLRKFSQPLSQLQHWTDNLSPEQFNHAPPDFVYPELNEMAGLIINSLSSVHDNLERERNFLRFTSHELRTPISVIRNNIQLIRKLETTEHHESNPKQKGIIDRIDRASLTMQHLSETLLWLSKDDLESLPSQSVDLGEFIANIIDELRYLLNSKPVDIVSNLSSYPVLIPNIAAHIVLANLIRNAFQHTWEGRVEINQQGNNITIRNHCQQSLTDKESSDQGFGLGLRLTQELCDKLNWSYHNIKYDDGHEAKVTLHAQLNPAE